MIGYIKKYIPLSIINRLSLTRKKMKSKLKKRLLKKMSLSEFEIILKKNMGLDKGDTILVHSSFGNLYADFSPEMTVECLTNIIGPDGNILMLNYPPGFAYDWLNNNKEFNINTNKSSMGILPQVFAGFNNVKKSVHPIKSVLAWGKDSEYLISEHFKSITPFDEKSPYYKMMFLPNSKCIGLGIRRNSFFHCCEDVIHDYPKDLYSNKLFYVNCIDEEGNCIKTRTYVHDPKKSMKYKLPCLFLKETDCPSYKEFCYKSREFYVVNVRDMYEHVKKLHNQGIYR